MTDTDDLRSFAQRAGWGAYPAREDNWDSWYVIYTGPDPALRALRDHGPFDNEADAWARAAGLAREYRNERV